MARKLIQFIACLIYDHDWEYGRSSLTSIIPPRRCKRCGKQQKFVIDRGGNPHVVPHEGSLND